MNDTIRCEQVTKLFVQGAKKIPVLQDITTTFHQGTTYAITGASGSGKSTLMYLLAGLETPTTGVVYCNNTNINVLPVQDKKMWLQQTIGVVFQAPYLIRELSVIENVMLPGIITAQNQKQCEQRARNLLVRVGLADKVHSMPQSLSGGQQQRVALARALFNKPAFLLADEPTGSLDAKTGASIVELLLSCAQEWGMGVIVSTHDQYVAQQMDTIYTLVNGTLQKQ